MGDFREDPWEEEVELHETEQWARVRKGDQPGKGHGARKEAGADGVWVMGVAA